MWQVFRKFPTTFFNFLWDGSDFASGVHKYLYAQDNPVDNTDPSGLVVSVYTHIVFHFAPIWRHASIRLYPDNTKDIPNDLLEGQQWQTDPKDARLYITIGAEMKGSGRE